MAERSATLILREGMYPDQSVHVRPAAHRFGIYYLRAEVRPYPSGCEPHLLEGPALTEAEASELLTVLHSRTPEEWATPELVAKVAGRMYRGTVKWFSEERGFGFVRCGDATLSEVGDIFVHGSEVCNASMITLTSGLDVCFFLTTTSAGFRASSVLVLPTPADADLARSRFE